jgi:flagella basal body P-ring formation protein FlgA
MMNPRPVMSMRKTVQLMVILTILAWATQTLFAQWGLGGLILPAPSPVGGSPVLTTRGATVELRPRAKFDAAATVTLADLCRWSDHDAAMMQPYAEIEVARLGDAAGVRSVTVSDLKARLHDAGANLSELHFTGSARCLLVGAGASDSDVAAAENEPVDPFETPSPAAEPVIVAEAPTTQPQAEETPLYEEQVVLTRPLSRGQRILAGDVVARRVQVEAPTTRPEMTVEQVVGNLAARAMNKGDVFDPDAVARPPVVTRGDFMTVALRIGEMDLETVVRAMETAAAGETIRARNEANGDVYHVVVTGPHAGRVESVKTEGVAVIVSEQ